MKSAPARPSPVVSPARQPRREAQARVADQRLARAVRLRLFGEAQADQRGGERDGGERGDQDQLSGALAGHAHVPDSPLRGQISRL